MNLRVPASSNAWSTEDVQRLRHLADSGLTLEIIATKLRRTRSAVRNKATMHGISLRSNGSLHRKEYRSTAPAMFLQRPSESGAE